MTSIDSLMSVPPITVSDKHWPSVPLLTSSSLTKTGIVYMLYSSSAGGKDPYQIDWIN